MSSLVKPNTRRRIEALLNAHDLDSGRSRGTSGGRWVVVRCDSVVAESVGSGNVLEQCYPATVILTASDFTFPPTEDPLHDGIIGAPVLLTVIGEDAGDSPVSKTPKLNGIYVGPLLGDVEIDGTGSQHGRRRVIAPDLYSASGTGTVIGTGFPGYLAKWVDTNEIVISNISIHSSTLVLTLGGPLSTMTIDPDGGITRPAATFLSSINTGLNTGAHIQMTSGSMPRVTLKAGEGGLITQYEGELYINVNDIWVSPNGGLTEQHCGSAVTGGLTFVNGFYISGTAGSGTVTTVSIVTANGISGSVANPTTTPAITFTLGAIVPSSVVASGNITGANLIGAGAGITALNATELTSGTIPAARVGTVDGGTW